MIEKNPTPSWTKMQHSLTKARQDAKAQRERADKLSEAFDVVFTQDRVKGYPSLDEWLRIIAKLKAARG